jgi:predicted DNA-binding antitoxin AbrB/MazE fold protein
MKETLDAVYEDGVFKPLSVPAGIREHRRVTLTVTDAITPGSLVDIHGLMPAEDADEMREIVEREFENVVFVTGSRLALDTSVAIAVLGSRAKALITQSVRSSFQRRSSELPAAR